MRLFAKTAFALALLACACAPAFAEGEPPARVGRVSFISGTLAFYGSGESDWSAAKINYPAAAGSWFATDPQSRAEIRIGADTIDIAGDTQLDIADLRDHLMQIAVTQGRIDLNLRRLGADESAEIDIPHGAVWLLQPGIYDIAAGSAGQPTQITVFEGSARFAGGGADLIIKAGDAVALSGSDTVSATVERAAPDAFVQWCRSRDYPENQLAAPYHVSPAMTGFEELDAYGGWGSAPDYGAVWYPKSVPADWAPYRDGQWVWVEPWGWNWVDAEPWGFAPFHYGRWARIEDRWGWVPGNFVPQPVYAPALVAFFEAPEIGVPAPPGTGPAVGWFPLAPGEVYWPAYTRDPAYIGNLNIANVGATRITEITRIVRVRPAAGPPPQATDQQFVNRHAGTVVPERVFANSGRVMPAVLPVPPQALQRAPVSVRPPQMTPAASIASASIASAPATPRHPPEVPNFHALAPAPSGPHGHSQAAQQTGQTAPGAPPPGHPPGPPSFSRLAPRTATHGQPPATQPPARAAPAPLTPIHPPGPPNFSHLAPAPGTQRHLPNTPPPAQAARSAPSPSGNGPPPPVAQALPSQPPSPASQHQNPRATEPAARQGAAQQATAQQQHAAQQAAAQQQAQQRAALQAAAQQQAQQRAAQQAAAQQQAQQRAAQQAAAQQQAQQRGAQQAAAQQQAQQRGAQQAAAQQQAQQRAARQAAAQQQAQQHAAQQAAAQQQAQQHAAQQAAAQQQARRGARQAAVQQQAQGRPNCGQPGQPGCPR